MIIEITEVPTEQYSELWFEGLGWYFSDETEQLIGPYSTKKVAEDQLDVYATYL